MKFHTRIPAGLHVSCGTMWSCLAVLLLMVLGSECAVDVKVKKEPGKTALTQEEKQTLLHMHNAYRSAVKPTASNMLEMVWSDDMANLAQEWANACSGEHRPYESYRADQKYGESLFTQWGPVWHEAKAVENWFRESEGYTHSTHKCTYKGTCNHYLALSWATDPAIGCGIRHCNEMPKRPEWGPAYYLVCNYGKRVIGGTRPYEVGKPCSKCPADHPKCRYNLCVTEEMYKEGNGYNGSTAITGIDRSSDSAKGRSVPSLVLNFLPVCLVAQLIFA